MFKLFGVGCLTTIGLTVAGFALSWIVTCGLIAFVCALFSWSFSWLIATGIWGLMILIRGMFK